MVRGMGDRVREGLGVDDADEGFGDGLRHGLSKRIWGGRSSVQKIDASSRFTLSLVPWVFLAAWTLPALLVDVPAGAASIGLRAAVLLCGIALCLLSRRTLLGSIDRYLGRGDCSARSRVLLAVFTVLMPTLCGVLIALDLLRPEEVAMVVMFAAFPFCAAYSVRLGVRRYLAVLLGVSAGHALLFLAFDPGGTLFAPVAIIAFLSGLVALSSARPSAWSLAATWQVEHAKETEARLAVAEERLRFGRDLHDVLGRNLAVIALKSELAVQLARRGRPAAVDQMLEVQRIAQDSQREVREVVRGYRAVDLGAELVGARSVLEAAGIECETATAGSQELPGPVQAALAWVVREAATNVLRHGDARRCTITLAEGRSGTSLTVENDGAPELSTAPTTTAGTGSGLAGLRERLTAVAGTLEAGPAGPGRFRLCARVPTYVAGEADSPGGTDDSGAAATSPATPDAPAVPDVSATPDVPAVPDDPAPASPSAPSSPSSPSSLSALPNR